MNGSTRPDPGIDARRSHWNRRSALFDSDFQRAPVREAVLDEMFRELPATAERALDAGTGTGRTLLRLARHVGPEARIDGTDISEGMLARARDAADQAGVANVRLTRADNGDLPFPDGEFGLVTSTFTLHHIPSELQEQAVREFRRVLADDGMLVIADQIRPREQFDDDAMRAAIAETFYSHLTYDDAVARLSEFGEWPLTVARMTSILEAAGFRSEITLLRPIVAVVRAWPSGRPLVE